MNISFTKIGTTSLIGGALIAGSLSLGIGTASGDSGRNCKAEAAERNADIGVPSSQGGCNFYGKKKGPIDMGSPDGVVRATGGKNTEVRENGTQGVWRESDIAKPTVCAGGLYRALDKSAIMDFGGATANAKDSCD